jgi:hypothetical protein
MWDSDTAVAEEEPIVRVGLSVLVKRSQVL